MRAVLYAFLALGLFLLIACDLSSTPQQNEQPIPSTNTSSSSSLPSLPESEDPSTHSSSGHLSSNELSSIVTPESSSSATVFSSSSPLSSSTFILSSSSIATRIAPRITVLGPSPQIILNPNEDLEIFSIVDEGTYPNVSIQFETSESSLLILPSTNHPNPVLDPIRGTMMHYRTIRLTQEISEPIVVSLGWTHSTDSGDFPETLQILTNYAPTIHTDYDEFYIHPSPTPFQIPISIYDDYTDHAWLELSWDFGSIPPNARQIEYIGPQQINGITSHLYHLSISNYATLQTLGIHSLNQMVSLSVTDHYGRVATKYMDVTIENHIPEIYPINDTTFYFTDPNKITVECVGLFVRDYDHGGEQLETEVIVENNDLVHEALIYLIGGLEWLGSHPHYHRRRICIQFNRPNQAGSTKVTVLAKDEAGAIGSETFTVNFLALP
jgi:hypothetical protein